MKKTLDYYLALPYTLELQYDPEDAWFIRVKELRGCMSQGDSPEEAVEMIQEALELWLEIALEDGDPIPEPRELDDYSGKFVVRVPRSLHRDLVEAAEQDGASLNQYINVALAKAVAHPAPARPRSAVLPFQQYVPGERHARAAGLVQEQAGSYADGTEGTGQAQGGHAPQDAEA